MQGEKTIAAISTGFAPGGIGIVRISGKDAKAVADQVFRGKSGKKISEMAGYTAQLGGAFLPNGEKLDDVVALVFSAPKSYTGEDVVELSCHGGLYVTERLLQVILRAGAAPAGPGEFTRRAFLHGKLDLTQAEAVMRLIGANGEQLGIVSAREAQKLAREAEMDLVKVAPMAKPPVCKIIDYGKFRYEQARKEKEARKKQKIIEIKEVRLSPNIDSNDLNTKISAARKFIQKGNKVKETLRFRGREMSNMNNSRHILEDFAGQLSDIAVVDKPSKVEGRSLVMFLSERR